MFQIRSAQLFVPKLLSNKLFCAQTFLFKQTFAKQKLNAETFLVFEARIKLGAAEENEENTSLGEISNKRVSRKSFSLLNFIIKLI